MPWGTAAAWTGTTAVFWAGNSPDGPAAGGVYDPTTDTWRRLPDGPLGPREGYVAVWTGTELLIVGGTSGDGSAQPVAAAVDPRSGSWRLLPAMNELGALRPTGAIWNGERVFLAGSRYLCPEEGSACAEVSPVFLAHDPSTDEVEEIDLARAPVDEQSASSLAPVGWTGPIQSLFRSADEVLQADGVLLSLGAAPVGGHVQRQAGGPWLLNQQLQIISR